MIFVVALDPASIDVVGSLESIGGDHLVGIFRALRQNCLLAEISGTYRLSEELKQAVQRVSDGSARKIITAILEKLSNPDKSRFVEVIDGFEEDYETGIGEILASQFDNPELDVIVSETEKEKVKVESTSILKFNQSNFARERSEKACAIIYKPGEMKAEEVLNEAFGRLVRHADCVQIYDRQMGKDFGDNYYKAVEHWCRFFAASGRHLKLQIHTTSDQVRSIERKFSEELDKSIVTVNVIGHTEDEQPHDRFIRTRVFTLDIGRGVDLFDKDGLCRDVKIGLSDHGAFTREWSNLNNGG